MHPDPKSPSSLPGEQLTLDSFRDHALERLTGLWETNVRNIIYGDEILKMLGEETKEFDQRIAALVANGRTVRVPDLLSVAARCRVVRRSLHYLVAERQAKWRQAGNDLRSVILEVYELINRLQSTLIDKDLLERQSNVLRNIILSHERVSQWKEFVQEILANFHRFFPFNLFFIAFAEDQGLTLNLYYLGEFSGDAKQKARSALSESMLRHLSLPGDTLLAVEEFEVPVQSSSGDLNVGLDEIISVSVPNSLPDMEGVLGVGYAASRQLGAREKEILRSILSVMVMVVGSSKALARTLGELEYYAAHDPLTGLHNQRYFDELLAHEIARCARHGQGFTLAVFDIDHFRTINRSQGHNVGDAALKCFAEFLQAEVGKGNLLARVKADQFFALFTDAARETAHSLAQGIIDRCATAARCTPPLTCSVGLAVFPSDGVQADQLALAAQTSLLLAKAAGGNKVGAPSDLSASPGTGGDPLEHFETVLREGRLVAYFHPIKGAHGDIHGFEVLARLRDGAGQIVSADQFIPRVERLGLCSEIDRQMVRRGLQEVCGTFRESGALPSIFVNISSPTIKSGTILDFAQEQIEALQLPPACLAFEVSEQLAVGELTCLRRFVAGVRSRGFRFSIDQFGAGYNSFHYLRELKIDYAKFDGSFIRQLLDSQIDQALVRNLVRLCRDLGIASVATFVESPEIYQACQDMELDFAQGFYVGVPRPAFSSRSAG